jgi:pimeloyl-ACP methyl ester carboxylesterase
MRLSTFIAFFTLLFSLSSLTVRAGELISVGDIKLYVDQQGKGEPLILLHGGLGSGLSWSKQLPEFSKKYKVILVDSRGQGRSTDGKLPLTYHLMADDVIALMDKLQIDSARFVGWSDGGNIAIDLVIFHPTRVKAFVAYGANIDPAGLQPDFLNYLRTANKTQLEKDLGREFLQMTKEPERLPEIVQKITTLWLTEPQFTKAQLASIKVPGLILDGKLEEAIRPDHAAEIAAAIPSAKLLMLPDVGHYAMFSNSERFNREVLGFLAAH